MKKLRLIEVPSKSTNHFINNVGCLRFQETSQLSSVIEPQQSGIYLEEIKHRIVGYTEIDDKKYIVIENI